METRQKAIDTKRNNHTFTISEPEKIVYELLQEFYGNDNIFQEYQDIRYSNPDNGWMFKCDFHIKSKDLFIELNYHPTHYLHPYDPDNEQDKKQLLKLQTNDTKWNRTCIDVWTIRDPIKFNFS